jgi:hypothetical protein
MRTRLLLACLIATLAFPAIAGATFPFGDAPQLAVRHENGPGPTAVEVSAPAPVRDVTAGGGSTTLPTVLAAVALGIALSGTGYVAVRLRSLTS